MRLEKKSTVDQLKSALEKSHMLILADHTGLSSNKMNELRARLKGNGAEYMVVKNRLLKRALDEQMAPSLEPMLAGPTGIAVTAGDGAMLSRLVIDFAKKNEAPKVKAGFFEGAFLTAAQVGVLASLPSRGVLLGMLAGSIQGPLAGFARILGEMLRRFAYVVDQVAKKKGPDTPITANKDEQSSPKEPVATSQEQKEPVATGQEQKGPEATSQEPKEPVATSQEPKGPEATSQEPKEPEATSQEPKEPVATSQEPKEPMATGQEPKEPVATGQEPVV